MTLGSWLDTWMKQYKKDSLRPTTFGSYEQQIRVHINPSIGHIAIKDLRPDIIQEFYNEKFKSGRQDKEGSLSPATIRKIHNILHEALSQAFKNGLVVRNVTEATVLPKLKQKEIRVFLPDEQYKFIETLKGERLEMAFLFDMATGLRLGELLALKWVNIDLKEGIITIKESLTRVRTLDKAKKKTELITQGPKTKSGYRKIPLPESILTMLKQHKISQSKERIKAGGIYNNNDLVFCTELGNYIEPRNFMRKFYSLVKKAEIPHTNVHSLRHTFATRMLEAGESAKVVQDILGHSNITQTLNTYTHVLEDTKKAAMQKINYLFQVM